MSYRVKKECKTCGKLYVPCADCERDKTAFHWRTVACSYECGMKYFEKVMTARSKNKSMEEVAEEFVVEETITTVTEEVVVAPKKRSKKTSVVIKEEIENAEVE